MYKNLNNHPIHCKRVYMHLTFLTYYIYNMYIYIFLITNIDVLLLLLLLLLLLKPYKIEPAALAILGHKSAHSFPTGPVTALPFISPLLFTITPALSSK